MKENKPGNYKCEMLWVIKHPSVCLREIGKFMGRHKNI